MPNSFVQHEYDEKFQVYIEEIGDTFWRDWLSEIWLEGIIEGDMCNEILMCDGISTLRVRTEGDMVLMHLVFGTWICGTVNLLTKAIVESDMENDSDRGVDGMEEKVESLREQMVLCVRKETNMLGSGNDAKIFPTTL